MKKDNKKDEKPSPPPKKETNENEIEKILTYRI